MYLITRQRASCLRIDDIPQQVADDIHAFGVMGTREFESLMQNGKNIFFVAFFIQAAGLVYHHDAAVYIIKDGEPPLYLITRQRASCLRLDDIQNFVLMICNSCGTDDIHAFGVIEMLGAACD